MKLASFVTLASLTVCAFTQSIDIGYPYHGKTIKPGQHLTVQVNRPATITGSEEVSLVISLKQCPKDSPCPDPADSPGSTLYSGAFDPKFPASTTTPDQAPQQNFTVILPDYLTPGRTAQLAVTHHALVGESKSPLFEVKNVTLKVVPNS